MTEEIQSRKSIGYVVGGGLKENLSVRLDVPAEDVQEGAFVVIGSPRDEWLFHGLITDIRLNASDPRFAGDKSDLRLPAHLAGLFYGRTLFTDLEVLPTLMTEQGPPPESPDYKAWQAAIDAGLRDQPRPLPIKTIPAHHSPVSLAGEQDIALIFGKPDAPNHFVIGTTREQGHPVAIDLRKFVQRSSGVFGATGTGKSFLTRLLLAGLIHHDVASILVLDMHNEYGFDDTASDTGEQVTGLKTKFSAKVRVVGLGAGATIRGRTPDFNLEIAMRDIQPEDIELLTRELNLKETTPTTLEALAATFGRQNWFQEFKSMKSGGVIEGEDGKKVPAPDSVAAWANAHGVNVMAAEGLHSKLRRVFSKDYIVAEPASDAVAEIIKALEAGQNVVLSFGKHEADLDYLLVSNLLTRRIRSAWEARTNAYRSSGKDEPRPLVIAVEEAHKLLNRENAAQTTFSTIARELRKYYVTLLIIDQRPSQIYDEVMSQLGTRISGWLGDDDDLRAVLSGLAGRDALRGMLARLQPKEEVLLLGWGVPMPLPVRSRRYDENFWKELAGGTVKGKRSEKEIKEDLGLV
ncbi:MAG: ATP-binding protein [Chloroflexi bacterium]|nr:ATP-binding protein [Chloroflexota bacterium]MQC25927.1 ATP-binding protein [Chloroflexota bacterium]